MKACLKRCLRRLSILLHNLRNRKYGRPRTTLLSLPNDVLCLIASHLPTPSLLPFLLANRHLAGLLTFTNQLRLSSEANMHNWHDPPALHWAAAHGHASLITFLLAGGTDINLRTATHGTTALHYAARNNHPDVVKLLLSRGAAVDLRDNIYGPKKHAWNPVNLHGMTPLHYATVEGREKVVRMLLDAGADIEARDEVNGRTPLILAAANERVGVLKVLLEKGAKVEAVDRYGWRALSYTVGVGMTRHASGPGGNRATGVLEAAERKRKREMVGRGGEVGVLETEAAWGGGGGVGEVLERVEEHIDRNHSGVGEYLHLGDGPFIYRRILHEQGEIF